MNTLNFLPNLADWTDQCVKCGMCLQHCPTYLNTYNENESPRGRISLIQGVASNQLQITPSLIHYLDTCTKCRACEHICPSQVPYGKIIDHAHHHLTQHGQKTYIKKQLYRLGLNLVTDKRTVLKLFAKLLIAYQILGLRWLVNKTGLLTLFRLKRLARLERLLPPLKPTKQLQTYYAPHTSQQGQVCLFTGCLVDIVDQDILSTTINLLNHWGYAVYVPRTQVCCGALHYHNGYFQQAVELAKQNIALLNKSRINPPALDAIVSSVTGCGAHLKEYNTLLFNSSEEKKSADTFADKIQDICTFLSTKPWPKTLQLKPYKGVVAIHTPCSLVHVLREEKYPSQLLKKIPQIKLVPLPQNNLCCGAAGSYMLTQPKMADLLRDRKLSELDHQSVDIIVSSNIGCALHLAAGIKKRGLDIEVLHPIQLLERQLLDTIKTS